MEQKYDMVPMMITGKDLDYLSDMFNWNYEALKEAKSYSEKCTDEDLIDMFNKAYDLFKSNIDLVLSILDEGGSNE